jgi:hypothetical protein
MDTTFSTYQMLTRDMDRTLKLKSAEPIVARETEYYKENIGSIKTLDDFFKNTRIYNYAVKAFGLEDMAYAKAYMRKVLTEGTGTDSFAFKLNDDRFMAFARAFDFGAYGEVTTGMTATTTDVVTKYINQTLEVDEGTENEGVRLALYFKRMAPTVSSAVAILADKALSEVVKTVLGLPDAMGTAGIDQQVSAIEKRLDVADFKDPKKLDRFIMRFTAMFDLENGTGADPVLTLFKRSSTNVTMSILSLKIGG